MIEHRHVEKLLQRWHCVSDDKLPAMRARVRHFRDLGVPDVAKVGTGARTHFRKHDIAEMHFVLTLSNGDMPPSIAVDLIKRMRPCMVSMMKDPHSWLIIHSPDARSFQIVSNDDLVKFLPRHVATMVIGLEKFVTDLRQVAEDARA